MLIYFVLLFIVVVTTFLARKNELYKTRRTVFLFLAYVAMVFVAGFRNFNVGTDTTNYILYFDKIVY